MASNRLKTFPLTGGEDFVTTPLEIPDGMARVAFNYEQNYDTGYTRINGYRMLVNDTTPGEGPIRGLAIFNNLIYMFRNKTGGLTGGMWVATPAVYDDTVSPATVISNGSWTEVTDIKDSLGAATTLNPDGYYEFITHNFQATANELGSYQGDWTASTDYGIGDIINDAAGALGTAGLSYITTVEHKSSGNLVNDAGFWHLINWGADANTGEAHDISGTSGNLYGVDGKNPAFEFDGTTLTQINSTYTNDTPQHIEANGNRLVLGFRSGEIAISVAGFPKNFDPVFGAGSIGVTDFLTGMLAGPDGVLYIFTKNKTYIYYGMQGPLSQTELKKHSKDVGAFPYTERKLGNTTLFFDTYGFTELEASDVFGDVITNSLSTKIQPILLDQQPVNSVVLQSKAQYRVYFQSTVGASNTTTCLMATLIRGENIGFTHAVYPFEVSTAHAGRIGQEEVNLTGSEAGEVYQMDVGTNFDGEEYTSYLTLPFNYLGSPHRIKKVRKIMMNIDADDYVSIEGAVDFSFGQRAHPKDVFGDIVQPAGSKYGQGVWGEFFWGTGYTDYVESYVNGHGENISVTLSSTSSTDKPHTLKDITFIYQYQRIDH